MQFEVLSQGPSCLQQQAKKLVEYEKSCREKKRKEKNMDPVPLLRPLKAHVKWDKTEKEDQEEKTNRHTAREPVPEDQGKQKSSAQVHYQADEFEANEVEGKDLPLVHVQQGVDQDKAVVVEISAKIPQRPEKKWKTENEKQSSEMDV